MSNEVSTMTNARQSVSFTLANLLAHLGSLPHANDMTAYEREIDRLLERMRRRAARCEAPCRNTEEKCLVGLTIPRQVTAQQRSSGNIQEMKFGIRKAPFVALHGSAIWHVADEVAGEQSHLLLGLKQTSVG